VLPPAASFVAGAVPCYDCHAWLLLLVLPVLPLYCWLCRSPALVLWPCLAPPCLLWLPLLLPLLVPQPLLRAMLLGGLLLLSLVLCVAPQQALPLLLLLLLLLLVWVGPLVESPPPSLCLKTS
jgi:hypothetical protein